MKKEAPAIRFYRKIAGPLSPSLCWEWQGFLRKDGYGTFWSGETMVAAHRRWSYEQHVGPIGAHRELHHACRTRHCVNPSHLQAVEHAVHMELDAKGVCKRGHALEGDNLYVRPDTGERVCRECGRAYRREWKRSQRTYPRSSDPKRRKG